MVFDSIHDKSNLFLMLKSSQWIPVHLELESTCRPAARLVRVISRIILEEFEQISRTFLNALSFDSTMWSPPYELLSEAY